MIVRVIIALFTPLPPFLETHYIKLVVFPGRDGFILVFFSKKYIKSIAGTRSMGEASSRLKRVLFEGFSIFALIVLLFIMLVSALNTGAPLLFVILGFLPTIITIVLCIVIFDGTLYTMIVLWVVPFVLSGVFLLFGSGRSVISASLDVGALAALNIVFSVIYLSLFLIIVKLASRKHPHREEHKPLHAMEHADKPSMIKEYVSSIEDKSKALNFALGRVYNKYHGGSKSFREKLALKPQWYNEFSDALRDEHQPDKKKLLTVLGHIESQLGMFHRREVDLMNVDQLASLKNLVRDPEGLDSVLEVLKKNDKDPVEAYYEGAKEFCLKLRDVLQ
jgi:hypothetical protein